MASPMSPRLVILETVVAWLALADPAGVTIGVLGSLVLIWWLTWTVSHRFTDRTSPRIVRALGALVFVCGVVLAAAMLSVVWGRTDQALLVVQRFSGAASFGIRSVLSVIVLVGAYVGSGYLHEVTDRYIETNHQLSQHQGEVVYRLSELAVYILSIIVVLGFWNIDIRGLIVGAGFLGIVVGMAARQTLGSLLAGFVLMLSRPFDIGDWVEIADEEGIVTDVTIFTTRIQTFDGKYVMIPNDTVTGSVVRNLRRRGRLRIAVEIGVGYDTDPDHAIALAEETMRDLDIVRQSPRPQAVLLGFGESAVDIELRFWIDKPNPRNRWRAQTAVISAVKAAYEREDIEIPYPHRELLDRSPSDEGHSPTEAMTKNHSQTQHR